MKSKILRYPLYIHNKIVLYFAFSIIALLDSFDQDIVIYETLSDVERLVFTNRVSFYWKKATMIVTKIWKPTLD